MLSELAFSALTDVILACELFFLAGLSFRPGLQPFSPAWIWALTLALIGLASMLGAIDHGFFEAIGHEGLSERQLRQFQKYALGCAGGLKPA